MIVTPIGKHTVSEDLKQMNEWLPYQLMQILQVPYVKQVRSSKSASLHHTIPVPCNTLLSRL